MSKKRQKLRFNGGSVPNRSLDMGAERTINFYPVLGAADRNGLPDVYLYPTEGLTLFSTGLGEAVRGTHVINDIIYFVVANKAYKLTTAGTITELGTINTSAGTVHFADIFDQILLVDGLDGWLFTISANTFTQVVDADFPSNCESICGLAGYFIAVFPDSQDYAVSNLSDGMTWTALFVGSAQFASDNLVAVRSFQDQLWLFGTTTIEQHVNTGNLDFPFEPRLGASILYGVVSEDTIAMTGAADAKTPAMVWLGTSQRGGVVPVALDSYNTVTQIFNPGVIEEINTFDVVSDAYGFIYQKDDHLFYVLTFPTADKTYVYDFSTGLTHERESYDTSEQQYHHWVPRYHAVMENINYVVDFHTGVVYTLDGENYTENGVRIRRKRRITIFKDNMSYKSVNDLWIIFNLGSALIQGQGSEPEAMLRLSHDGGRNFDTELTAPVGVVGQYYDTARFSMLGTARKWCAELSVTDPIRWVVLESFAEISDEEAVD